MTVANSIKAQLEEAAHVLRQQMARIAELEAEVERLRSAAGAHDVLRSIYTDANQPTGHRLKAAGLALGVESAPLKATEAPLDLVAEPIEPLADVIARQRARADRMKIHNFRRCVTAAICSRVMTAPAMAATAAAAITHRRHACRFYNLVVELVIGVNCSRREQLFGSTRIALSSI
jgi:hypothetical protein